MAHIVRKTKDKMLDIVGRQKQDRYVEMEECGDSAAGGAVHLSEPRCCCRCMSVTQGAVAVGVAQLVKYCAALLGGGLFFLFYVRSYGSDNSKEIVISVAFSLIVSIVMSAVLIHGARTACGRLVRRWVCFHGVKTTALTVALLVLCVVLGQQGHRQLHRVLVIAGVGLALLVPDWFFLSVGVRLLRWLSAAAAQTVKPSWNPDGVPAHLQQSQQASTPRQSGGQAARSAALSSC